MKRQELGSFTHWGTYINRKRELDMQSVNGRVTCMGCMYPHRLNAIIQSYNNGKIETNKRRKKKRKHEVNADFSFLLIISLKKGHKKATKKKIWHLACWLPCIIITKGRIPLLSLQHQCLKQETQHWLNDNNLLFSAQIKMYLETFLCLRRQHNNSTFSFPVYVMINHMINQLDKLVNLCMLSESHLLNKTNYWFLWNFWNFTVMPFASDSLLV